MHNLKNQESDANEPTAVNMINAAKNPEEKSRIRQWVERRVDAMIPLGKVHGDGYIANIKFEFTPDDFLRRNYKGMIGHFFSDKNISLDENNNPDQLFFDCCAVKGAKYDQPKFLEWFKQKYPNVEKLYCCGSIYPKPSPENKLNIPRYMMKYNLCLFTDKELYAINNSKKPYKFYTQDYYNSYKDEVNREKGPIGGRSKAASRSRRSRGARTARKSLRRKRRRRSGKASGNR